MTAPSGLDGAVASVFVLTGLWGATHAAGCYVRNRRGRLCSPAAPAAMRAPTAPWPHVLRMWAIVPAPSSTAHTSSVWRLSAVAALAAGAMPVAVVHLALRVASWICNLSCLIFPWCTWRAGRCRRVPVLPPCFPSSRWGSSSSQAPSESADRSRPTALSRRPRDDRQLCGGGLDERLSAVVLGPREDHFVPMNAIRG